MTTRSLLARLANPFRSGTKTTRALTMSPADDTQRYFYLGPDVALARMTNGTYLFVDPSDRSVGIHLIARGYWEAWIYKAVCALVRPGDHVIDVGANFGYYTLALAVLVGSKGSVQAFEANPRLAELVHRSVEFNGCRSWVTLDPRAASNENGHVDFAFSRANAGGGAMSATGNSVGADTEFVSVPTVRLDDVASPETRFIRIDAEGSEPLILKGAERLLQRPDIVVCMEWDVFQMSARADVPSFCAWLAGMGFRFWRINLQSTLTEIPEADLPGLDPCDLVLARQYPYPQN